MNTLEARINIRANRGNGPTKPRFSKLSEITIIAIVRGDKGNSYLPVASRTIPGAWNAKAALAEFMKAPKLFMFEDGYNADSFRGAA